MNSVITKVVQAMVQDIKEGNLLGAYILMRHHIPIVFTHAGIILIGVYLILFIYYQRIYILLYIYYYYFCTINAYIL